MRPARQQVATAGRGVHMRAVEKQGDFLLLEADSQDGGHGGGALGWADASCVVPTSFPALYQFATDLPDAVRERGGLLLATFLTPVRWGVPACNTRREQAVLRGAVPRPERIDSHRGYTSLEQGGYFPPRLGRIWSLRKL